MTHDELIEKLFDLGFNEGWGVRDGKIVVWENSNEIPNELADYADIDVIEPSED